MLNISDILTLISDFCTWFAMIMTLIFALSNTASQSEQDNILGQMWWNHLKHREIVHWQCRVTRHSLTMFGTLCETFACAWQWRAWCSELELGWSGAGWSCVSQWWRNATQWWHISRFFRLPNFSIGCSSTPALVCGALRIWEQFYPADPSCNVQGLGEYLRRQLQLSLPPAFFGLSGARWLMKLVELCVFWLIQYVSTFNTFNDVQAMGATWTNSHWTKASWPWACMGRGGSSRDLRIWNSLLFYALSCSFYLNLFLFVWIWIQSSSMFLEQSSTSRKARIAPMTAAALRSNWRRVRILALDEGAGWDMEIIWNHAL